MRGMRAGLAVVLVAAVGVGAVVITKATADAGSQDIFMEPAASVGQHPFTTGALAAAEAPVTTAAPQPTSPPSAPAGPTTTALYGGSGSQRKCDPAALIAFLETHADKAAAWVGALNADPTLQWTSHDGTVHTKV